MEGPRQRQSSTEETTALSSQEESGWTEYLEDSIATSEEAEATSACSSCTGSAAAGGSSLVSDAASRLVPRKTSPSLAAQGPAGHQKLKRRTVLCDDSLEDTASSPAAVSGPKVNDPKSSFIIKNGMYDDVRGIYQGKDLGAGIGNPLKRGECKMDQKKGSDLTRMSAHWTIFDE